MASRAPRGIVRVEAKFPTCGSVPLKWSCHAYVRALNTFRPPFAAARVNNDPLSRQKLVDPLFAYWIAILGPSECQRLSAITAKPRDVYYALLGIGAGMRISSRSQLVPPQSFLAETSKVFLIPPTC